MGDDVDLRRVFGFDETGTVQADIDESENERADGQAAREQPRADGKPGLTLPSTSAPANRFLTDVIVEMGMAAREQVDEAIARARSGGGTPEDLLVADGVLTEEMLSRALAERYRLPHVDLGVYPVDMTVASLLGGASARRYRAVPIDRVDEQTLLVAMSDPANVLAVDDIAIMTGKQVRVAVAAASDVNGLAGRLQRLTDSVAEVREEETGETPVEQADELDVRDASAEPVIRLVNRILAQAIEYRASDVHMAAEETGLRVRFRVDGVLQDVASVNSRMAPGVISRVKITANLNIAEKRLPQDGRVSLTVDGRHVDLRIVTLPGVHGESIVMRVLDRDSVVMNLASLGMGEQERDRFETAFGASHGAVLVTGPTGSGKSTTLYAALMALNSPERNVITVEDPVEYRLDGITQVQVNPKVGLSFASGLRAMVRADPDVLMVGEIRDQETAQIAVESALTGHLVLSSLHTNDAPGAIPRLIEMGIEPFLVSSAVECVLAQRLLRILCPACKSRSILPVQTLQQAGVRAATEMECYEPVGCGRCGGDGYTGRVGIYEVMLITGEIRDLTLQRAPAEQIRRTAIEQGMRPLRADALEKVRAGITSLAEMSRVIGTGG